MRFTGVFSAAVLATASANFLDGFQGIKTLTSDLPALPVDYNSSLPCGSCVRSGNIFCQSMPGSKKVGSTCCSFNNATECALDVIKNRDFDCATTDTRFTNSSSFFSDGFVELA